MKRIYIIAIFLAAFTEQSYSQCSTTAVLEAVRNGDFENGYLGAGGATDFYSDFAFGGANKSGTGAGTCGCCQYGMGDQYAVAKGENFTCAGTNFVNNTYWGISYGGDVNFKDHTTAAGDGFALLVDLHGKTTSQSTGGLPIAWEQTVDVFPSQNYWFSAYVANFSTGTAPVMQVTVVPELAGVPDVANTVILPAAGTPAGLMNWTQMTAQWTPVGIYDKVTLRFEFVNVAGGSSGVDVVIDDISFINSCQNFASENKPTLNADTVNLCSTAGTANLIAAYPSSGNETYAWFDGTSNPQTLIAGVTGLTHSVTTTGTYRVCVQDPDNSCATNDVVVVLKDMQLSLPDVVLCSPVTAAVNVDASLTPTGVYTKNYVWTVPGGETDPGNSGTSMFTTAGNYSVSVTNPSTTGCSTSANFTITSTLPTAPTNLRYCSGGGVSTDLIVGDGKSYVWSTSNTMIPIIGTGVTVPWIPAGGTTGNQTLYIQSAETSPLGSGGPTTGSLSGYPAGIKTLTFTTTQTVELTSVGVNHATWVGGCSGAGTTSGAASISISGTASFSTNPTLNCGAATTANLGWVLPPGTYTLTASEALRFSATSGTTSIGGGVVNITSTGQTMFGNLVFATSEACDPLPVIVQDSVCCTQLAPTATQDQTVVCVGTAVTLTATPDALTTGAITYQWYSDAGIIAGETGTTYYVPNGLALAATDFWVTVTTSGSCAGESPISNKVNVTINPNPTTPTITINPNQTTFCMNDAHDLTAASTVTGGGTINYVWSNAGSSVVALQTGTTTPDGSYTYKVVADVAGCKDSLEQIITVSPLDSAKITVDTVSTCANVGNIDLSVLVTTGTSAGTWSGTGVTGTDFSTAQAAGVYKQVYTTSGTCPTKDSMYVNIVSAVEAQIIQIDTTVCAGTGLIPLPLTSASAIDGVWSGTGYSAGSFDPTGLAAGPYEIKYVKLGLSAACSDSDSVTVTITALDSAKITPDTVATCANIGNIDLAQYLTGGSSAGTWSGTNVTGTDFSTTIAGGVYKVVFTTAGTCPTKDSTYINVTDQITASVSLSKSAFCANESAELSSGSPGGGVYWGFGITSGVTGNFDPSTAIAGTDTIFYGIAGSCGDTTFVEITVNALDSVKVIPADSSSCANMGNIDLSALITGGTSAGTWSGTSVTGTDFSTAIGAATYNVVYTTSGACPTKDSLDIIIVSTEEAQIVQGDTSVCMNTSTFALPLTAGSATDGVWSGTGYSAGNFDPTGLAAGAYMIKYVKNGISAACSDSDSLNVTIIPLDVAQMAQLPSLCSSDSPIQLTLDGSSTTGGVWADSLAANTYVNLSGVFDPTGLPDGNYKVYYATLGACKDADSGYVAVVSNITYTKIETDTTMCLNHGLDTLKVDAAGGVIWTASGNGVVNAADRVFNTNLMVVGTDTMYYGKAGSCGDTIKYVIVIEAIDVAAIDTVGPVCIDTTAIALSITGPATGGTYVGAGVTGSSFNPGTAGIGTHMITYKTPNECFIIDTTWIEVKKRYDATISFNTLAFCGAAVSDTLWSAESGGTWSGWPGSWSLIAGQDSVVLFDPSVASGTNQDLIYTIADQCGDADTVKISVTAMEIANIDTVVAVCADAPAFNFTVDGASTVGGAWSPGTGSAAYIDAAGLFTPSTATEGTHVIRYKTPGGCFVWDSLTITVLPRAVATISGTPLSFCNGFPLGATYTAAQSGGTWSGWAGSWSLVSGADSAVYFNSSIASGVDSLYYEIGGTCGAKDSIIITVSANDVALITPVASVCVDAPAFNLSLDATATTGGAWADSSGSNVYTSTAGLFTPSLATAGTRWSRYITNTIGCPDTDYVQVLVKPRMDATISRQTLDFCVGGSSDIATGKDLGGLWTGWTTTTSSAFNVLTFNPTTAGEDSIVYTIADDAAVCGDADTLRVTVHEYKTAVITGKFFFCQADGDSLMSLSGTSTTGGTWSGLGVNATTGVFDPTTALLKVDTLSNQVIYTTTSGRCDVADTIAVEVVSKVVVEINLALTDVLVCSNDSSKSVFLTDESTKNSANITRVWSSLPVGFVNTITGELNLTAMAADLSTETYTIKCEIDAEGTCKDEDQVNIRMITLAGQAIIQTPSVGVCITDTTDNFVGDGKGEFWTVLSGSATIDQTGEVTFLSSGESEIAYIHSGEGECPDTARATLSVVEPIDATIENRTALCDNEEKITVGSSVGVTSGTWRLFADSVTGTLVDGPDLLKLEFDPKLIGAGKYVIQHVTNNGFNCPDTAIQYFDINAAPVLVITAVDPTVCLGEAIVYQVDNGGATLSNLVSPNSTWIFADGLPMDSANQVTKIHSTSETDDKRVVLYQVFDNSCKVRDTVTLAQVDAIPEAAFTYTPYQPTVLDPKIQFLDSSDYEDRVEWYFGRTAAPALSSEQNPYVKFDTRDGDTINVCLVALSKISSCADTVCKDVVILNNLSVYIPNSFTPNGDGLNDVFYPLGKYHDNDQGRSEYEFLIFNRWGETIFKSTKPYTGWNGVFAGHSVQEEVYVWTMKVYDPITGSVKTSNGTVTVVR